MSKTELPRLRILQGCKPGLLDPTQPSRILRHPDSTLSFAVFNPLAATGSDSKAGTQEKPSSYARRIVVETLPGARIKHWRYVDEAELGPGVQEEGSWPRLVVVCG